MVPLLGALLYTLPFSGVIPRRRSSSATVTNSYPCFCRVSMARRAAFTLVEYRSWSSTMDPSPAADRMLWYTVVSFRYFQSRVSTLQLIRGAGTVCFTRPPVAPPGVRTMSV